MNPVFKRFRLVDDEEYQRQKLKHLRDYNPELMTLANREMQIEGILHNPKLSNEQKLLAISSMRHTLKPDARPQEILQPYSVKQIIVSNKQPEQELFPYLKKDLPIIAAPDPLAQRDEVEVAEDVGIGGGRMQITIDTLPAVFRPKAMKLNEFLSQYPNLIQPSVKNELIIHGNVVPGSNFSDLFKYIYNPGTKVKTPPIGFAKLVNALLSVKTPPHLVSNKLLSNLLTDAAQSGSGRLHRRRNIIAYAKSPQFKSKSSHIKSKSVLPRSLKLYKI